MIAEGDGRAPGPEDLVRAVRDAGIADPRVLEAFQRIQRTSFVPSAARPAAYEDAPVPIGHDQVTTQPSLVARMVEALHLRGDERVLEIGAGLGFQTAILATLCRQVFSVEWFADLAEQARTNLAAAGMRNAMVVVGDGTLGLSRHAPFNAVVVAAAAPAVAAPLAEQLAEGGRLVQPLGPGGRDDVVVFVKRAGGLVRAASLTAARFVPLRGTFGAR